SAHWQVPLLKLCFTIAYVVLAPFAGPLADAWPKGRVMLATNSIKAAGCLLIAAGCDPLLGFVIVGLGAAGYSPAKYGLITEIVPPQRLVEANGWIEVSTVGAIILGTVLGGALVGPLADAAWLLWTPPAAMQATTRLLLPLLLVLALYALAAALNFGLPDSGARYAAASRRPLALLAEFRRDNAALWRDPEARISLAVTTLFWGVGATLQFLVLRWAIEALDLDLHQAAYLQGVTAIGITAGAALAGRCVPLGRAGTVLPLGIAMGLLVPLMTATGSVATALPLLILVGGCAGFFVVPMNALLQHRGYVLLSAGRSIAVQNFNENLSVLLMLAAYAALLAFGVPIAWLVWGFGIAVAVVMALIGSAYHKSRRSGAASLPAYPQEHA
ncbi:MAG TPA: lysophospholipid transporter LplT, partial [Methylibium sp.]